MRRKHFVPALLALAAALAAAPRADAGFPLFAAVPAQSDWVAPGITVVVIGLFATVVIINIRKSARRRAAAALAGVGVRTAEDGFWLDAPGLPPGTRVRYRCTVAGAPRPGWAKLAPAPGGTFVHTGGTPSEIRLLEIEEAGAPAGPQTSQEPTRYGTLDLAPPPSGSQSAPGQSGEQPPAPPAT